MRKPGPVAMEAGSLSRRAFLAAPAAGSLAARATKWQMRLSTSSVHFWSLPVEEACARIAAARYEAVDFWPARFKCPHLDEIADRLGADGLKQLLAKYRLKLCAFTCYLTPIQRYAEILGKAGGGVVIRGSQSGEVTNLTAQMRALLETLKPDLELAEKHGFRVAIENHGNALLNTLDSFRAFLDMNRHPRLGIAIAPYHLQRINAPVEEAIRLTGKQLFFFYAWQNAPELKQLPGVGPTDFTPWLEALAAINYPAFVNPFMHGDQPVDVMAKALTDSWRNLLNCRARL